jgi:hypothetical protein
MNRLKNIAVRAADWLPDALMVGGAGAVSFGAGQVYAPAMWVVGGVFALVAGLVLARGAK